MDLAHNPNTPSDALESMVKSTKNFFVNHNVSKHPNVTERIRRLVKMNDSDRKLPNYYSLT